MAEPAATAPRPAGAATAGPLAPLHAALAAGRPVNVLQLGDSHTANDAFSGRLRELLQARAGDGGRGLLPPGVPHPWYRPARVTVTQDGFTILRAAPAGFPALRQHADGPAAMLLSADPGDLAHVTVELLRQPGGGTVTLTVDGQSTRLRTDGTGIARLTAPTTAATRLVTLAAAGDGPVDVLAWSTTRPGGSTWSNLGTPGATIELAARWDPAILAEESGALPPTLIVLAFGTNEGFKDGTDLAAYPALVRDALGRLRRAAPGAAILVAGPPAGVRPLRDGGTPCPGTAYAVPPNLPRVRAILRTEAAAAGAAWWDWSAAMGGDCAVVDWAQTDPPLAARDHVHLLVPGARRTAEALFDALTR